MNEYIFLGDSITDCDHLCEPDGLGDGYVRFVSETIGPKYSVINLGYDGFTISSLNRLWNRKASQLKPAHITILIGINDVGVIKNTGLNSDIAFQNFQDQYELLIKNIRSKFDCPIMLMEPFIFPYPQEFLTWYPEVQKISSIIQKIAETYQLQFLPTWNALLSIGNNATTDGIHLTEIGHRFLADLWKNAVDFSLTL